jgi:hypothetical protein
VLELVEVVNLDNSYFKILTKSIQLEANQAHQMVTDLSIIREELRK